MVKQTMILAAILATAGFGHAGLVATHTGTGDGATNNGTLDANEYGAGNANAYAGGGGGGGSVLDNTLGAGTIYMDNDAANLYIGFQPGAEVDDHLAIMLNVVDPGGQNDSTMNDDDSGKRSIVSNASRDTFALPETDPIDVYPGSLTSDPDYAVGLDELGEELFELTSGNADGHLNLLVSDANHAGLSAAQFREVTVPLTDIGNPGSGAVIQWFAYYGNAGNGCLSNQTNPPSPTLNGGADPCRNGAIFENHNEYVISNPLPVELSGFAVE